MERTDRQGRYTPYLALAYYYRSAAGPDNSHLGTDNLEKAYVVMKDNLLFGFVPDEIMEVISSQYVRYLDVFDPPMSATVKRGIVELSFTFPDPPVVRWKKRLE